MIENIGIALIIYVILIFGLRIYLQGVAFYLLIIKKEPCLKQLGEDELLLFLPDFAPLVSLNEILRREEAGKQVKRYVSVSGFYKKYILLPLFILIGISVIVLFVQFVWKGLR